MMSILPLFLLVGVVASRHITFYIDPSAEQPIVTRAQERQICAELCLSGLGGTPCGADCMDIIPQGLPLQSVNANSSVNYTSATRFDSCKVLCKNNLGNPLCNCDGSAANVSKVDFVEVCDHFCSHYDYRIYGCQECSVYKNATSENVFSERSLKSGSTPVDWGLWCQAMCQNGEGGAACNCDLLPMSLTI